MQGHPTGEWRRGETLWSCRLPSTSAKPRDPMAMSYHGGGLRQLLPANDCQPATGCVSLLFCQSQNPWSWDSLEPGREARHAVLEDVLRHSSLSSSQACPAETGECILHLQEKSVLLIRVPTYVTASESDSFREHIKREAGQESLPGELGEVALGGEGSHEVRQNTVQMSIKVREIPWVPGATRVRRQCPEIIRLVTQEWQELGP